jgi:hypothetical protein
MMIRRWRSWFQKRLDGVRLSFILRHASNEGMTEVKQVSDLAEELAYRAI